ncbi:Ribonuclease E, partial [hydrothermal vent metagenome]
MKIIREQTLLNCLEMLEAGVSIEEIVAKHSWAAVEIETFLRVAVHLQQMSIEPPRPAARQKSQQAFLAQAAAMRADKRKEVFSWQTVQKAMLPLLALAMVLALFGIIFISASTAAVPGQLLYNTKRFVESYRLEQAEDPTAVANLRRQASDERVREVRAILRTDQTATVSFQGRINAQQPNSWVIAGIRVILDEQTEVEGTAVIGALAQVNGRTQNGQLHANSIIILQEVPATPTPDPTPPDPTTPTPDPTDTPPVVGDNDNNNDANDNSGNDNDNGNDNSDNDNSNDNSGDNGNDNSGDNSNDNSGDNGNDNSGNDNDNDNSGNDNSNDNSGNDNGNDNSGDNGNDNSGNDNGNDNSGNDNDNDNSGNDNGNDNSGNDNGNDNSGNDNGNDNSGNDNGNDNSGND